MNKIDFLKQELYINKHKFEKLLLNNNIKTFEEYIKNKKNKEYKLDSMIENEILKYHKLIEEIKFEMSKII
jgi:hypothetical protein